MIKSNFKILITLTMTALSLLTLSSPGVTESLPTEKSILTSPPEVPPVITRTTPAKVIVELEVREYEAELADGVKYTYWSFGGTVPGKFIRVREGDTVELHFANHPSSKLPHNIDLHAVTGPGGGAASTFTAPGHKSQFSFKAINPGLYIYHCATAPVGMHIANGMYGLIYVQPKTPLPAVDKEYYVLQSEFYTQGNFGEKGFQPFSMQRAIDENPAYVVFNGSTTSLTGDKALTAQVGQKIRLFVGNGGPNLISSFHVIGEIFDSVYTEGGTTANQHNVQTTLVPAGGSAIVDFTVEVPGSLVIVDHSIFRTFNKGSLGMIKVTGAEDKTIYSGKEVDEVYLAETAATESGAGKLKKEYDQAIKDDPKLQKLTKEISMAEGEKLYKANCSMCHQLGGDGVAAVFPPVAKSDFLMKIAQAEDRAELVNIIKNGKSGAIKVNGVDYNGVMPALSTISDREIAAILTYISNSWGNKAKPFTEEEIKLANIVSNSSNNGEH